MTNDTKHINILHERKRNQKEVFTFLVWSLSEHCTVCDYIQSNLIEKKRRKKSNRQSKKGGREGGKIIDLQ